MKRRLLRRGTRDHYRDAALYDFEYRRRRFDVRHYELLARAAEGPILELGCGTGRIALPLARAGHRVVGLDLNRQMLARARQRVRRMAAARRRRVLLVEGDLLRLPLRGSFSLVIAAFNTLQHVYDSEQLVALFAAVRQLLAADGRFAFDVMLPDLEWLMRDPERRWIRRRFTHPESGEKLIYSTNHVYEAASQICYIRIYYDPLPGNPGRPRVVHLAHRQYFPQELRTLLRAAGLQVERCEGGFAGERLRTASESQVYVCSSSKGNGVKTSSSRGMPLSSP